MKPNDYKTDLRQTRSAFASSSNQPLPKSTTSCYHKHTSVPAAYTTDNLYFSNSLLEVSLILSLVSKRSPFVLQEGPAWFTTSFAKNQTPKQPKNPLLVTLKLFTELITATAKISLNTVCNSFCATANATATATSEHLLVHVVALSLIRLPFCPENSFASL